MLQYSPKIITDGLVMCLDASQNKSYPIDLPVKDGLVMWMDAADDTTFSYSSGTTVSQWRDKSGLGYHMTPLSAGPSRGGTLNSRKILNFSTSQTIGSTSLNLASSANTVFVVSRLTGVTNRRVLTAYNNNWLLGHWSGWVNQYYAEGWIAYQATAADTVWRIYMGDWGGSSNDVADAFSNGTSVRNQSTAQASAGPNGLGINYLPTEESTCEAAEIIVFNRTLSATERKQVHTYLGQKWGILNTDRSIIDLSGNGNNLLFGNGTTANMPSFDYYNKGALNFDGTNDLAKTAGTVIYTQSTTWEAWVKRTSSVNSYNMFMGAYLPYFALKSDNSLIFSNIIGSTQQTVDSTGFNCSNDIWYYLSFTTQYDGTNTTAKIYINGVLNNSGVFAGIQNEGGNSFAIGDGRGSATWYPFNGKVSNVKIYNRTLTAAEILQNYEAQKLKFINAIIQNGLVLNLDANNPYSYGGAGTTWYDVSGTGNNATLSSGPTFSSDVGGNIVYDGVDDYSDVTISSLTTTVTLEFWVKYTNLTANMIFGFLNYDIYANSGSLGFNTGNSDVYGLTSTQVTNLGIAGNWKHMVFVMRSDVAYTNNKIYVNGVSQTLSQVSGSEYTPSRSFNSGNGRISGWKSDTSYKLPGSIGSFRAYNRELTASEILINYNATKDRFGL